MFPFVPRKVAQKSKASHTPSASTNLPLSTPPATVNTSSSSNVGTEAHPPDDVKGKRKTAESTTRDEDLAAVLWLSLTDHSLWVNAELRRALASADDGWLPLSTLHRLSAYFPHVTPSAPESAYVRATRTHAPELLEVRMRVSAPSKAGWYGTSTSGSSSATRGDDAGGYEVRRKDWRDALLRARNSTRHEWEARTVYMECIPLAHRAVPSIYRFTTSLLDHQEHGLTTHIQAISLPSHHLDRPGDIPKPKGFALVTFSDEADASRLAADWPWLPRRAPTSTASNHHDEKRESENELAHEAAKYGFRVLRKARWDELKEEYLAYRQRLLDEIAEAEASGSGEHTARPRDPRTAVSTHPTPGTGTTTHHPHPQEHTGGGAGGGESVAIGPAPSASTQTLDPSAPFPPGCLVYVRHVHPETNKTTLKALFGAHAPGAAAALDYVDYNKGMATCHLRVSAPHHAQTLVSAFQARPLVQRQGLDDTGEPLPPDSGSEDDGNRTSAKAIEMEVVSGTREELYWSKVPEKVRREAVRKAIAQISSSERGDANGEGAQEDADTVGEHDGKRKRKRRRKA